MMQLTSPTLRSPGSCRGVIKAMRNACKGIMGSQMRGALSKGPGKELGKLCLDGIAEAPQSVSLGLQMKEMRKQVQGHLSEVCGPL